MPARIETRDSVFELQDTRTGVYELKKVEDLTPGKKSSTKVGTSWTAKTIFPPKIGKSFIMTEDGKEIVKTGLVLKISGNLME